MQVLFVLTQRQSVSSCESIITCIYVYIYTTCLYIDMYLYIYKICQIYICVGPGQELQRQVVLP